MMGRRSNGSNGLRCEAHVHIHILRLSIVHRHMVRCEWDGAADPKSKGDILAKSIVGIVQSRWAPSRMQALVWLACYEGEILCGGVWFITQQHCGCTHDSLRDYMTQPTIFNNIMFHLWTFGQGQLHWPPYCLETLLVRFTTYRHDSWTLRIAKSPPLALSHLHSKVNRKTPHIW